MDHCKSKHVPRRGKAYLRASGQGDRVRRVEPPFHPIPIQPSLCNVALARWRREWFSRAVLRVVRSAAEVRLICSKQNHLSPAWSWWRSPPLLFRSPKHKSRRLKKRKEEYLYIFPTFLSTFYYMAHNISRKGCFKCGNRASIFHSPLSLHPSLMCH